MAKQGRTRQSTTPQSKTINIDPGSIIQLLSGMMQGASQSSGRSRANTQKSGAAITMNAPMTQTVAPGPQPGNPGSSAQAAPTDSNSIISDVLKKAAEKKLKTRAEEMMDQGVPPDQILKLANNMAGEKQTSSTSKADEVGVIQQVLGTLLTGFTGLPTKGFSKTLTGARELTQEQSLNRPLSRAEREKAMLTVQGSLLENRLESQNEFFSNILNPEPMPPEREKALSFAETMRDSVNGIEELIGVKDANGNITELDVNKLRFARPGTELRQKVKFLRDELVNAVNRRDSGAAVTETEIKTAEARLGIKLNMKAFLTNKDALKFALDTTRARANKAIGRLAPNERISEFVKSELQLGTSKEEIYSFLESTGRV